MCHGFFFFNLYSFCLFVFVVVFCLVLFVSLFLLLFSDRKSGHTNTIAKESQKQKEEGS